MTGRWGEKRRPSPDIPIDLSQGPSLQSQICSSPHPPGAPRPKSQGGPLTSGSLCLETQFHNAFFTCPLAANGPTGQELSPPSSLQNCPPADRLLAAWLQVPRHTGFSGSRARGSGASTLISRSEFIRKAVSSPAAKKVTVITWGHPLPAAPPPSKLVAGDRRGTQFPYLGPHGSEEGGKTMNSCLGLAVPMGKDLKGMGLARWESIPQSS